MKSYLKMAAVCVVGVGVYIYYGLAVAAAGCFITYLVMGGWRYASVIIRTFPRDLFAAYCLFHVKWRMHQWLQNGYTISRLLKENVVKHPNKVAFIFEDQRWTFRDVDEYTNSVANYFYDRGFRKGDVIAIFMENRFEVVGLWLGLSKIGVISALINFNLRRNQLMHCFNVSLAKAVIFGSDKSDAIQEVIHDLGRDIQLYSLGSGKPTVPSIHIDHPISQCSTLPPPHVPLALKDKLFFIFTSGTTGLPKAAIITHTRYCYVAYGVSRTLRIRTDDVIYDVLPLYHMAGTMVGVGQSLIRGNTVVLVKKFSASRYWEDCIKYKCTVAQYIGEICRYILVQPIRPTDTQHSIRMMFGNGLRPELWEPFRDRFNVPQFGEFYGATEGNCNIVNIFNKPGAVGFTSRIITWAYPITLIRVDKETGEPIRDGRGVCIKAKPGEQGELVGRIIKDDPVRQFDGYMDKAATSKKLVTNVFKLGDMAFRSGDILEMDELGYMYFRDRTGDTFRWKGENVSTMEVEGIVSQILGHRDSVVYGVEVFGNDGRAGMAAVSCQSSDVDLHNFESQLENSLPSYARPIFLRFCKFIDTTGTFKLRKVDLRKDGYDPKVVQDPMYYYNTTSRHYEPLTTGVYELICAGKVRL